MNPHSDQVSENRRAKAAKTGSPGGPTWFLIPAITSSVMPDTASAVTGRSTQAPMRPQRRTRSSRRGRVPRSREKISTIPMQKTTGAQIIGA